MEIELLPARHGDAILLSWDGSGTRHRMLVDAGPAIAYGAVRSRMAEVAAEGPLDLLVLTHVDADHVEGMIKLVNDAGVAIGVDEVWFNGWRHLGSELAGPHGEILTDLIVHRKLPWNRRFDGGAVCCDGAEPFPVREFPGGLRLTVLGPTTATLRALQDVWFEDCRKEDLIAGSVGAALAALDARPKLRPEESYLSGPPVPDVRALARTPRTLDTSVSNASTIVLLVEQGDDRVLLCGDATPATLVAAVRELLLHRGMGPLTAMTVPHHGSARSITGELVRLLHPRHYLFSSDGGYYEHPHDAAVATVLENTRPGAQLVFNYASRYSLLWDDERVRKDYQYDPHYPGSSEGGVVVRLGVPTGGRE
jgi:hypothetical protein